VRIEPHSPKSGSTKSSREFACVEKTNATLLFKSIDRKASVFHPYPNA
jgi:hypothetical protein